MTAALRSLTTGALAVSLLSFSGAALAQDAKSLDDLLKQVKAGYSNQKAELAKREKAFRADKAQQARLLKEAQAQLAAAEKKSTELEERFQENERKLAELEETLRSRLGTMGELFGVVRQVAGDTAEQVRSSLTSADNPGREPKLRELAAAESLPNIPQLEHLWYTLQQEMTESGKVVRFQADVIDAEGNKVQREVVRVGGFNVVSEDGYLQYLPDVGAMSVLARQPPDRYLSTVDNVMSAKDGQVRFATDPSRGAILGLLVETPTIEERLALGGAVGYIILGLGAFALLVGLARFVALFLADMKMRAQLRSTQANTNNPLGRVLKVYEDNRNLNVEDLERKLDEVIVRESGRVEQFIWIVKVVAGAAPLLGLLGTVTGMIRTFQAITLFGTGDPKLMAGGISEALVTTMLGLVVAVPLVIVHAILTNSSKRLVDIIEEQAAGVVARRAESEGNAGG
ncbi:MAG: MotA/TolQ/ExbB proton channel family protein [Myxococcota bacterium]